MCWTTTDVPSCVWLQTLSQPTVGPLLQKVVWYDGARGFREESSLLSAFPMSGYTDYKPSRRPQQTPPRHAHDEDEEPRHRFETAPWPKARHAVFKTE